MDSLIIQAKNGDKKAIEKIINDNQGYIYNIIKRYSYHEVEMDELYQEAVIGMMIAIKKYDEKFNVKFLTFATYYIKGQLTYLFKRKKVISNDYKNVSFEKVLYGDEDKRSLEDILPIANNESSEIDLKIDIEKAISSLTSMEKSIIKKRLKEGKTLKQCGQEVGLSYQGVKNIETEAFLKLRKILLKGGDEN